MYVRCCCLPQVLGVLMLQAGPYYAQCRAWHLIFGLARLFQVLPHVVA